jgi:NCS2 family nucleobase:cation symporter-2
LLSGQHLLGLVSFAVFPLLVAQVANVPKSLLPGVFSTAFLTLGVANLLQARRLGPIGTGFLVPSGYTAAYLAPCLIAAKTGGMPLVAGMTIAAGMFEIGFSRVAGRLRALFPTEVLCVVLILVGLSNGFTGMRRLTVDPTHADIVNCLIALCIMILAALFRRLALYAVLAGVAAGYMTALVQGSLDMPSTAALPAIGLPTLSVSGFSFDASLLMPFAVVAIVAAIKQTAFCERAQRFADSTVLPEVAPRGVLADGLGTVVGGLLGSIGVNASASSAGLIAATGITTRRIAWVITLAMLMLSLLPQVGAVAAAVPKGTVAAVLLFTSVFVVVSGMTDLGTNLDRERSLVVGCSLIAGLAIEAVPAIAKVGPDWAAPLLGSSLAVGTLAAILLTGLIAAKNAAVARIA